MIHSSPTPSISLPIIAEVPLDGFNSENSDEEVASTAHPTHDVSAVNTNPVTFTSTMPVDRPTSPVPLTANPKTLPKGPPTNPTIRILQPTESDRDTTHSTIRPWTDNEDQELINLKHDSKSRPSCTGMQNSLEPFEATVRPTWHGNASERTGGRGLRNG